MNVNRVFLLIVLTALAALVIVGIVQSPPGIELRSKIENNYDKYNLPNLMLSNPSYKMFFNGKEIVKYHNFQAESGVIGLSEKGGEKPDYEVYVEVNQRPVEIGESGIFVSLQKTGVTSEFLFFKEGSKMFEISLGLLATIIIVSFVVSMIVKRLTRKSLFSYLKGKITGIKKDWEEA